MNYAYSHGVTIVAAAGNNGTGSILYPAAYPHVIAVAATDSSNTRAWFSNFGPQLALSAPGVDILSTYPGGYAYLSGTSMATPFVSGLAAILRGIPGNGSPDVIAWEMESSALDLGPVGRDNLYGYGLIQMDRAINRALTPTSTPTETATLSPANSGPNGSGGSGAAPFSGFSGISTFTPTLTWTPNAVQSSTSTSTETTTALPTSLVTETAVGTTSQTPEVSAQQTHRSAQNFSLQVLILPCGGGLLILLGVLVVLQSRKKRRPVYYRLGSLK